MLNTRSELLNSDVREQVSAILWTQSHQAKILFFATYGSYICGEESRGDNPLCFRPSHIPSTFCGSLPYISDNNAAILVCFCAPPPLLKRSLRHRPSARAGQCDVVTL